MTGGEKLLLQEYFALCPNGVCSLGGEQDSSLLTESEQKDIADNGAMYLTGIMQRADAKNNNMRVYPYNTLYREIEAYQKAINERRSTGSLDHKDDSIVTLQDACILVTKIWWEGKDVWGKMKVTSNRQGKDLRALISDGIQVGISSRGLGSISESSSGLIVEDDFQLICFDIVSDPSTHGAFMRPTALNEGQIRQLTSNLTKADRINRALQDVLYSMRK